MIRHLAKLKQEKLLSPDQVEALRQHHHFNLVEWDTEGNETQVEKLLKKKQR